MTMYAQQVHNYLQTFFKETDCEILNMDSHSMQVQLTIDIDKKIMNRPFYWQYIEATNSQPNPAKITLITERKENNQHIWGEVIHFGSNRLNQIFKATKELGSFVQMYEKVAVTSFPKNQLILRPYFCVNYKVSYYCDQTKERLYSLGINLINGEIKDNFHESISNLALQSEMQEQVYYMQYIIKPSRGLERLDQMIQKIIQDDDHSWAEEAKQRWAEEQKVLDYFYEDVSEKPEAYLIEKKAIEERFNPRIKVEIINGGLFYLK